MKSWLVNITENRTNNNLGLQKVNCKPLNRMTPITKNIEAVAKKFDLALGTFKAGWWLSKMF